MQRFYKSTYFLKPEKKSCLIISKIELKIPKHVYLFSLFFRNNRQIY